jgi:hypothetical protein
MPIFLYLIHIVIMGTIVYLLGQYVPWLGPLLYTYKWGHHITKEQQLEQEVARLQKENAELAIQAERKEYR